MEPEEYRQTRSQKKHLAIVKAAQNNFLRSGYARTSVDQIAQDANVSTATLYKHFSTKADLFGGVMAQLWEGLQTELSDQSLAQLPPREALLKIGQDYAVLLTQDYVLPLFRVVIAEAPNFPELGKQLYEKGKKPYLNRIETYLKNQHEQGVLAVPDPELATRQFLGMINDVVFWPRFLVIDLEISSEEIEQVVEQATQTFLSRYTHS